MSDKGYQVIAKINLPPEKQYHSGHSLIVQGDTVEEVEGKLAGIAGGEDQAHFIMLRFAEYALGGAAAQALQAPKTSEAVEDTPARPAPASDDLASQAVIKAVAKKTGKTPAELEGLTDADAKKLLKGGE